MIPELKNAELIIMSDIHLLSSQDLRGQRFLHLCHELSQTAVKQVLLLGDIFDFILGSHSFYHSKFQDFGRALSHLTNQGIDVHYVEGNHEYDLKKLPWPGVQFWLDLELKLVLSDGKTLLCTHGDQVHAPLAYQRFRSIVKSKAFLKLASWVPGPVMDWLALRSSEASRAQDQYRTTDHSKIIYHMDKWLQGRADFGVFGHFHNPYAEKSQYGDSMLLSCSSWDQPNLLAYESGRFVRLYFTEDNLLPSETADLKSLLQP